MFSKLVVPMCFVLAGVRTESRRWPVPSRLVYGPTVPIGKAAAALGRAASMANSIVANAPVKFGSRISQWSDLRSSAAFPSNSFSRGAYSSPPESARGIFTAEPFVTVPRYAAPVQYGPAYAAAGIYAAPRQHHAPQSYSFGYHSVDEHGNRQSRQEESDANNFKKGSYSFTDVYGISRRVDYVADDGGFRALVNTNEPGTAPSAPAAVLYGKAVVHRKA